jgi:hypothetical protein
MGQRKQQPIGLHVQYKRGLKAKHFEKQRAERAWRNARAQRNQKERDES